MPTASNKIKLFSQSKKKKKKKPSNHKKVEMAIILIISYKTDLKTKRVY